jgi:RNA polymerase sigma-70 factor (ECF subfamily)
MKTFSKSSTDEKLVELFVEGCNEAFEEILSRYKNRLYRYIFQLTNNRDLTEDIFQDTFIKVIMSLKQRRYIENGTFFTWICKIAHNLVIDYFRREAKENTFSNDECQTLYDSVVLEEKCIQDTIIEEDICREIAFWVDALPEPQRAVIQMRFYQDLSFKEIAEELDISINTALGRMRYAIINLRKLAEKADYVVSNKIFEFAQ